MDDAAQCLVLERVLLSERQRTVLRQPPRWDLNPPQREEYDSPKAYVRGLRAYAERVLEADFRATTYGKLHGARRRR